MNLQILFFLFRVHRCFLQKIKVFSWRHRLHFLLALLYGLQFLNTFPWTWKDLLVSLRVHTCLTVPSRFFSSGVGSQGCQVISELFFEVSGYWAQCMILIGLLMIFHCFKLPSSRAELIFFSKPSSKIQVKLYIHTFPIFSNLYIAPLSVVRLVSSLFSVVLLLFVKVNWIT